MQTEFSFQLPGGFIDADGMVHREGVMRRAKAMDEISSVQDPRVQSNEAYLPVILMSRVITRLGNLSEVTPSVIENLFAADLTYLEDLYLWINNSEQFDIPVTCPHCSSEFSWNIKP